MGQSKNTVEISPHKVALHRWNIFTNTSCAELAKQFKPDEMEVIRGYFEASSFRTHRTDLDALTEDITQCQCLREMMDFQNDEADGEKILTGIQNKSKTVFAIFLMMY